jgi:hypothetical protein
MQLEGAVAQKEGDVASLNDQVSWPIHQRPTQQHGIVLFFPFLVAAQRGEILFAGLDPAAE